MPRSSMSFRSQSASKARVHQQGPGIQILKQRAGFVQVVGLPRHQTEINEVAKRVGERQYLRGYSAPRASDGLAKSPPFAP